jgi:hypothetical protein
MYGRLTEGGRAARPSRSDQPGRHSHFLLALPLLSPSQLIRSLWLAPAGHSHAANGPGCSKLLLPCPLTCESS